MSNKINNKTAFCQECNESVTTSIEVTTLKGKLKGNNYTYEGEIEKCLKFGHNVIDKEMDKHNLKALHDAYRIKNNIILLEKIRELPEKYDIGKRPISNLLEWGELTFTRYFEGDIPSKAYSNMLEEIYNSPQKYLEILECNKNYISQNAYKKSLLATNKLLKQYSKISDILNYILYHSQDITPLSAQKLLYYAQGFHYAFFQNELFNDDCCASIYGPVYSKIYDYSNKYIYPNNLLVALETDKNSNDFNLSVSEKIICDSIIKNLGCYSGKVLTNFTITEKPWLNARHNLKYKSDENPIIDKNDMFEYFSGIVKKYDMMSAMDIHIYAKKIFNLI